MKVNDNATVINWEKQQKRDTEGVRKVKGDSPMLLHLQDEKHKIYSYKFKIIIKRKNWRKWQLTSGTYH